MKWEKFLSKWKGILTSIVAIGGAIGTIWVFAGDKIDQAVVSESELASVIKAVRTEEDIKRLNDLQRDLIGGRYNNDGEKAYLIEEIKRLQKLLLCEEQDKCE